MKKKLKKLILNSTQIFKPKSISPKVIYYHDVVSYEGNSFDRINKEKFTEQMRYIKENNYTTILLQDMDNLSGLNQYDENKYILITFDDGYRNNYRIVYPIMKELDLKFNVFLEVGAIENNNNNYLDWNMIKEMHNSGIVGFGAHTYTHKDARFIHHENSNLEINRANRIVLEKAKIDLLDFCFPYGAYNKNTINFFASKEKYKRLYTSDGNKLYGNDNINVIGRVGIENEDSIDVFIDKLNGKYDYFLTIMRLLKVLRSNNSEITRKES